MKEADILMQLSFHQVQPIIRTKMGAIVPVSVINRMVIRGLDIILVMSTGVIAAEVCIFAPVSAIFRQSNSTLRWVRE
jgi:hypothetical protein